MGTGYGADRGRAKKGGVLDMDTHIISTITSHGPGYLNKEKETIVGFQTDKPFKRALQPNGGIRMAIKACEDNGYHVDPEIVDFYTKYRKTHNERRNSTYIHRKCEPAVPAILLQGFRMPMDAAVSSVITDEWLSTEWIV